ncbi:Lumazine-binding protein [Schizopora paradoxa]|uniref:Riboflavin synthase n=1 Tax=Schizopora paradoxa TaxID=27342 RepID=A0A0H2S7G3_9AGAM|nr:Lumazine-binding protein [Schizopora paradoxa]
MFTGLVELLGKITNISADDKGRTLVIGNAGAILNDCHIGDSIAVNGACLTVTEFDKTESGGWFSVWLANETLTRTELGDRDVGAAVNLERAMEAHTRFGGHFVQAHVDTTATILSRTPDGDSVRVRFKLAPTSPTNPVDVMQYLIPKGYVALDGTSLTLTDVDDKERTFEIMLIKHTQERVTLGLKPVGERVNVEVDMVGKFVEKSVRASLEGGGNDALKAMVRRVVEEVVAEKLK